jgi:uncharacterized YigZ family protein
MGTGTEGRQRYPILAGESRIEEVIERSRFITTLAMAASLDEARAFIGRVGSEFKRATHNCHAFLVGPPGSTALVGLSDAGEPHGTAGQPMLNVLVHSGIGDVACVVTRFFGGVKLGKGGLSRAYGGSVKRALELARRAERVEWRRLLVELDYSLLESVQRVYGLHDGVLESQRFDLTVLQRVRVPLDREAALLRAIGEASAGRARVVPIEESEV